MPLKTSTSEELPSVNLTSMIDVVFLLIIFFMVGTQFTQTERQIDLKLPSAGDLRPMVQPPDQRIITVSTDGGVYLDGQPVNLSELTQRLQALHSRYPDARVAVRADGAVQYQHVAGVYGAAQRAGITQIATAVLGGSGTYR